MRASNQVTEHPILFSGPMVKAILVGRKTQTRRLCKEIHAPPYDVMDEREDGSPWPFWCDEYGDYHEKRCPYGEPGDRLWVRERWAVDESLDAVKPSMLSPDVDLEYSADGTRTKVRATFDRGRLRPSIHMPRWASRLVLEVTDMRVQRLQEISDADVVAEGLDLINGDRRKQDAYRDLWEHLNAARAPWASNPWVWAISFKVIGRI